MRQSLCSTGSARTLKTRENSSNASLLSASARSGFARVRHYESAADVAAFDACESSPGRAKQLCWATQRTCQTRSCLAAALAYRSKDSSSLEREHIMSCYKLIIGLSALAFSAAPAFAQPAPAQGTVQPRHMTHPAPAHKMPDQTSVHPDQSADQLNAKELASIQHGSPASAPMPSAPTRTP